MSKLYIIPIEPIETRYTKHWYKYLPEALRKNTQFEEVIQIDVEYNEVKNTDGGFFNFSNTMKYKSSQAVRIADMFNSNQVNNGDVFLITDYWNPTVHNIRYMSILLGVDVKIIGICHAGCWDMHDILGQKLGDYGAAIEQSFESLYDAKIFATKFSKEIYERSYGRNINNFVKGFPMEYYTDLYPSYWDLENPPEKENLVVFPHRKSPEKHPEIFEKVKELLAEEDIEFVYSLDECNNKDEYQNLLYRAKLVVSFSDQETLGIVMGQEALSSGCEVFVPNKLSYDEMGFIGYSRYNPDLIKDMDFVTNCIKYMVSNFDASMFNQKKQFEANKKYFDGEEMYKFIGRFANLT